MILKKTIDILKEKDQAIFTELLDPCNENKEELKQAIEHLLLLRKIKI